MAHAHHELPTAAKNEIMQLIFTEFDTKNPKKLRPVAITDVQGTEFFPWFNNHYEGYFLEVTYVDHKELWFAVDVSGEHDYHWFLERIR